MSSVYQPYAGYMNHEPSNYAYSHYSAPPVAPDIRAAMKAISDRWMEQAKLGVDRMQADAESMKRNRNTNPTAFEQRMHQHKRQLKGEMDSVINRGYESIIQKANARPEYEHDAIFSLWQTISGRFMNFLNSIMHWIEQLAKAVIRCIQRAWNEVQGYFQKIREICGFAMCFVSGLF